MVRQLRLPRVIEKEFAKLLSTLGFSEYASALWNLAARTRSPTSDCEFKEGFAEPVVDQAKFDPAVIASREINLPRLRRMKRNLQNTRGASSPRLLGDLDDRPAIVVLVGPLDPPTRDLLMLIDRLSRSSAQSFVVIGTEGDRHPAKTPACNDKCRYIHWPDRFSGDAASSARHLALFLHVSGANSIIVSGSRLGFQTIGQYGCALKNFQRLFVFFDVPETTFFLDVYHLRLIAPHATICARSQEEAEVLRSSAIGVVGPKIAVLRDDLEAILGTRFEDLRSTSSQTVFAKLLGRHQREQDSSDQCGLATIADCDVSVAILFHRERELAVPALASLGRMVEMAREDGISVEVRALVDRGDDLTRKIVAEHGGFLDDIREFDFGSPALARNAATALARGRFLAFLDGDDLWGADWLSRGVKAAASSPRTIWHPEALFAFWASDCDRTSDQDMLSGFLIQQSSDSPSFDRRDLLFENMWSVNAIAATDIHRQFPYRADEWAKQVGIEDWRWNLDTLGHGLAHAVVPDTVHLIRIKETGSFGQLHNAKALLPFLD